jgi:hypothetical protein
VKQEVESAEFGVERGGKVGNVLIVLDVARQDERPIECGGEVADVLLEPLARIGQRQTCAGGRRRLGNGPGDRSLVRHADDQAVLPGKNGHSVDYLDRLRP